MVIFLDLLNRHAPVNSPQNIMRLELLALPLPFLKYSAFFPHHHIDVGAEAELFGKLYESI